MKNLSNFIIEKYLIGKNTELDYKPTSILEWAQKYSKMSKNIFKNNKLVVIDSLDKDISEKFIKIIFADKWKHFDLRNEFWTEFNENNEKDDLYLNISFEFEYKISISCKFGGAYQDEGYINIIYDKRSKNIKIEPYIGYKQNEVEEKLVKGLNWLVYIK